MLNKDQIITGLAIRFEKLNQIIDQTEPLKFFLPKGEKWSDAEIVQHLILTNASVASIFKGDKQVWIDRFGAPQEASRSFDEMTTLFRKAFNAPVKAPSRYVPALTPEDTIEKIKQSWNLVLNKFKERVKNWEERDLDLCGIPHPALGMLTAREHLFFAALHTDHHIKQMG